MNTTVLGFRKDFLEVISELCLESRIDFSWLMMVEARWEKVIQAKEITFQKALEQQFVCAEKHKGLFLECEL